MRGEIAERTPPSEERKMTEDTLYRWEPTTGCDQPIAFYIYV